MSQLALALEARVSARHLGFVESGRANPSREMVLTLARALDVPLREQNELLVAAGFAAIHRETGLTTPDMARARTALDCILRQQEPFPAVVMDRHWNILMTNAGAARFFGRLLGPNAPERPNIIRLMFHAQALRSVVENWDAVAEALVQRLHREAVGGVLDDATIALLNEVLAYPGVPARWARPTAVLAPLPFLPVSFRVDDEVLQYFSTITTLGTPLDITLQEIRIECFHPADDATEQYARATAGT